MCAQGLVRVLVWHCGVSMVIQVIQIVITVFYLICLFTCFCPFLQLPCFFVCFQLRMTKSREVWPNWSSNLWHVNNEQNMPSLHKQDKQWNKKLHSLNHQICSLNSSFDACIIGFVLGVHVATLFCLNQCCATWIIIIVFVLGSIDFASTNCLWSVNHIFGF